MSDKSPYKKWNEIKKEKGANSDNIALPDELKAKLAEVEEEIKKEEPVYKHNWLYSMIPVDVKFYPALSGYCRFCDKGFVVVFPTISGPLNVALETMNIPKEGCVPHA